MKKSSHRGQHPEVGLSFSLKYPVLDFPWKYQIFKDTQRISGTALSTIVFLDPPKKMHVTLVGYSWNNQGVFLYSVFPEHYFGIFPGISYINFSKYSGNISWECSTNIPQTYICPVGHSFRIVLDESLETLRKLCLSTTFPHQEIRWNYGILRSAIITIFV